MVGISGGEPFVERRGLTLASRRITDAASALVALHERRLGDAPEAAGVDPRRGRARERVCLSTDAFHAGRRGRRVRQRRARDRAAGRGSSCRCSTPSGWSSGAEELLNAAFGAAWPEHAELCRIPPLTHGRGEDGLHPRRTRAPGTRTGLHAAAPADDPLRRTHHGLLQRERDHGPRPRAPAPPCAHERGDRCGDRRIPHRPAPARDRRRRPRRADGAPALQPTSPTASSRASATSAGRCSTGSPTTRNPIR